MEKWKCRVLHILDKTFRISPAVWTTAKISAAEQGISVKKFVETAVLGAVARHRKARQPDVTVTPVTFKETTDGRG